MILIIISVFDIFKYKTYEREIHESGDVVCSRSIEIQEEILKSCLSDIDQLNLKFD